MSYENIRINEPIFCIGPQAGGYYTLSNTGTMYVVYVKNNAGLIVDTYTLDPTDGLDYEVPNAIKDFIYIGPINQSFPANNLVFYTLESIEYINCENCGTPLRIALIGPPTYLLSCCPVCAQGLPNIKYTSAPLYFKSYIKKWLMDSDSKILVLHSTIEKISDATYNYEASALVVETLETTLLETVEPSNSYINLTTVSGLEKYDTIMVGPSTHIYSYNEVEWANVHSVVDPKVEITTIEGYIPTKNYYRSGDGVVIIKNLYLVCKCKYTAEEIDINEFIFHRFEDGYLYQLDPNDYGSMLEVDRNNIYNYTDAAVWDLTYKTIDLVYDTQLVFIDPHYNYTCIKSMGLFNHYEGSTIKIYDMDIVGTTFYMLQRAIAKRDEFGDTLYYGWTSYNYAIESALPYTNSVAIIVDDYNLTQNKVTNIKIVVRDQFGATLIYKNVVVYKEKALGLFDPIDGSGVTDADGVVDMSFHLISPVVNEELEFTVRVDGGGTHIGSGYVWDSIIIFIEYDATNDSGMFLVPYYTEHCAVEDWWPQYNTTSVYTVEDSVSTITCLIYGSRISEQTTYFFRFLLYHHPLGDPPQTPIPPPKPAPNFSTGTIMIIGNRGINDLYTVAPKGATWPIDVLYVSRHFNSDINKLSLDIHQFSFVTEAHPTFWSEKNTINTYIWLRLKPFAFDLTSDTLIFKIRETSYAGDTGWMNITNELIVTNFDAGGGLKGLDVMWANNFVFHNGGTVYVWIVIYDASSPPNRIEIQYWFKLVPDYLKPYIINEYPPRGAINVNLNTNISFDIIDVGSGVDINTIEVYVKSRQVRNLVITNIEGTEGNVHVTFQPALTFLYSDVIDIAVYANDTVGNNMVDRWLFYCSDSVPPWFNGAEVNPRACAEGLYKFYDDISTQVYAVGDGIDLNTIEFTVGEVNRRSKITPIIYRIE